MRVNHSSAGLEESRNFHASVLHIMDAKMVKTIEQISYTKYEFRPVGDAQWKNYNLVVGIKLAAAKV